MYYNEYGYDMYLASFIEAPAMQLQLKYEIQVSYKF